MPLLAYDSAKPWDRDRLEQVKSHSGIAVTVYIVGSPGGMRCANRADVDLARSMGLAVVPNWERAADFFRTASLDDCRAAGREALAACRALGFPDDGTIGVPFSFDYQVPTSKYGRARKQLAAIGQGLGGHYAPLLYGQSGLIRYLALRGDKNAHWLMASTWGLRFNPKSKHVAMVQSHDADGNWLTTHVPGTDVNTITQPAKLLAWWPDNSPYQEDDMPTADEIADALLNKKITVKDPVTGKKVKARVSTFIGAAWQHAKAADVQTKRK